ISTFLSILLICAPLTSTLFPYTTLFRSGGPALPRTAPHDRVPAEVPALVVRLEPRAAPVLEPHRHLSRPDGRPLSVDRRAAVGRSEEHTSELQSRSDLVCRLLLEKKNRQ